MVRQDRHEVPAGRYVHVVSLGSGNDRSMPGATTVDVNPATAPDIVHDLDRFPWPLPSDAFDFIDCREVIEHLADIVRVMEEVHRIGRNGARVHITTPHYSCSDSFTDPTHRHHLGIFSFDYFTGENTWGFYTNVRFRKLTARLHFHGRYRNWHISWLANRYPRFYEERLAWIFPAWSMSFDLEVVK